MEYKKKIKVLHIQETIASGGVEKIRLSLAKILSTKDFEQKIICTNANGPIVDEIKNEGVEVIPIGIFKSPFHWSQHKKVQKIIDKFQPNIIHGAVFEGVTMAAVNGFLKSEILNNLPNYYMEASVGDFPLALLAISKGDTGYIDENMAVYRLLSDISWSKTINNENRIHNNENARQTIVKFNLETNNQFLEHTKLLSKNIYYHYGLYYAYKAPLKKISFIAKNFFKLGILNTLKLLKNNL